MSMFFSRKSLLLTAFVASMVLVTQTNAQDSIPLSKVKAVGRDTGSALEIRI